MGYSGDGKQQTPASPVARARGVKSADLEDHNSPIAFNIKAGLYSAGACTSFSIYLLILFGFVSSK
jgi:hypothetical protein